MKNNKTYLVWFMGNYRTKNDELYLGPSAHMYCNETGLSFTHFFKKFESDQKDNQIKEFFENAASFYKATFEEFSASNFLATQGSQYVWYIKDTLGIEIKLIKFQVEASGLSKILSDNERRNAGVPFIFWKRAKSNEDVESKLKRSFYTDTGRLEFLTSALAAEQHIEFNDYKFEMMYDSSINKIKREIERIVSLLGKATFTKLNEIGVQTNELIYIDKDFQAKKKNVKTSSDKKEKKIKKSKMLNIRTSETLKELLTENSSMIYIDFEAASSNKRDVGIVYSMVLGFSSNKDDETYMFEINEEGGINRKITNIVNEYIEKHAKNKHIYFVVWNGGLENSVFTKCKFNFDYNVLPLNKLFETMGRKTSVGQSTAEMFCGIDVQYDNKILNRLIDKYGEEEITYERYRKTGRLAGELGMLWKSYCMNKEHKWMDIISKEDIIQHIDFYNRSEVESMRKIFDYCIRGEIDLIKLNQLHDSIDEWRVKWQVLEDTKKVSRLWMKFDEPYTQLLTIFEMQEKKLVNEVLKMENKLRL